MMKIATYLTMFLAGSAATAMASSNDAGSAISVEFEGSESYTDFKTKPVQVESDRMALQQQLRDRIRQVAASEVPSQYHLELTIRDIDLAGDFEPEQGPNADDVRIVRDVYPPRITLDYTLTGPGGDTVSSGTRTLTDLAFQKTLKTTTNDNLFYEAQLIRDFVSEITQPS